LWVFSARGFGIGPLEALEKWEKQLATAVKRSDWRRSAGSITSEQHESHEVNLSEESHGES